MKKTKTMLLIAIAVVIVIATIVILFACSNKNNTSDSTPTVPNHEHVLGDWIIDKPATYEAEGKKHKECLECGEVLEETNIPILKGASEGLEFALNEDGESYYVKGIGNCTDTEIVIPAEYNGKPVTAIGEMAFAPLDYENEIILESNIISIVMPNTITDIRMGAFAYCNKLRSIIIPDSVINIEAGAFSYCSSLVSITLGKSVTNISNDAFNMCVSLIEVCNKSFLNIEIGSGGHGLVGAYAKSIITDESESAIIYVNEYVFYDDGTEVYFVKYLGDETEITLPEYNNQQEYSIWQCAFKGNKTITSVSIPDCVINIGYLAFEDCTSLISITLGGSVAVIEPAAFSGCNSLSYIILPESLMSIGAGAFDSCSLLTQIVIPKSVVNIGEYVFSNCDLLTIYCRTALKPTEWDKRWNHSEPTDIPVVWGYTGE